MPGFAYKSGDKYKVFVGIRRLLAVKELYEKEGKPNIYKAFVFKEKPKNFYELIRMENVKRADLSGLDKLYIILKFWFADKILPIRYVRYVKPLCLNISSENLADIKELLNLAVWLRVSTLPTIKVIFSFIKNFSNSVSHLSLSSVSSAQNVDPWSDKICSGLQYMLIAFLNTST